MSNWAQNFKAVKETISNPSQSKIETWSALRLSILMSWMQIKYLHLLQSNKISAWKFHCNLWRKQFGTISIKYKQRLHFETLTQVKLPLPSPNKTSKIR